MKHWMLCSSTAAAALLIGQMAWADVTPEDVWQNWQDQGASSGQRVEGATTARDGDTLVITGAKFVSEVEGAKSEASYPEIRMTDKGDGTVEITLPSGFAMSSTGPDGKTQVMTGTFAAPGMVTLASGAVEAIDYAYTIPEMTGDIAITEEGQAPGKVTFKLTDGTGRSLVKGPKDDLTMEGEFAAASAAFNIDVSDSTDKFVGSLNVADLAAKFDGKMVGMEDANFGAALAKGFGMNMTTSYGAATFDFGSDGGENPGKISGTQEGGQFDLALGKAGMKIAGGAKNVALVLTGMGLPFPEAKLNYAESGFNLTMPMSKSEEPGDFALLVKYVDLAVSDEIWGMLDPMAKLPHDPATLIIDTKGKAKLNVDLMDEAAMTAMGETGTAPGELQSLDVTEIKAKIAGAELTGAGAFTFDNTDLATFGGMPAPTGKLDLKLTGGNTLLDKLVEMGMLSQDDVMGYKMMLAMFANSAADKDEMTSTIEAKDKHLYVNGQMMQ